jgi:hypothetical protein
MNRRALLSSLLAGLTAALMPWRKRERPPLYMQKRVVSKAELADCSRASGKTSALLSTAYAAAQRGERVLIVSTGGDVEMGPRRPYSPSRFDPEYPGADRIDWN